MQFGIGTLKALYILKVLAQRLCASLFSPPLWGHVFGNHWILTTL